MQRTSSTGDLDPIRVVGRAPHDGDHRNEADRQADDRVHVPYSIEVEPVATEDAPFDGIRSDACLREVDHQPAESQEQHAHRDDRHEDLGEIDRA